MIPLGGDSLLDRWRLVIIIILLAMAAAVTVSGLVKRHRGRHRGDPVLQAVQDRVVEQIADGAASLRQQVAGLEAELAAERQARCALSAGLAQAFGAAGMTVPGNATQAKPGLRVIKGGQRPA